MRISQILRIMKDIKPTAAETKKAIDLYNRYSNGVGQHYCVLWQKNKLSDEQFDKKVKKAEKDAFGFIFRAGIEVGRLEALSELEEK